tara:strand:- start:2438 stop:2635 length:198 start_codon:yes stop_codon:yes gene_type:complete
MLTTPRLFSLIPPKLSRLFSTGSTPGSRVGLEPRSGEKSTAVQPIVIQCLYQAILSQRQQEQTFY